MNAATVSARFAELFPESNLIGLLSRYGGDADDIFEAIQDQYDAHEQEPLAGLLGIKPADLDSFARTAYWELIDEIRIRYLSSLTRDEAAKIIEASTGARTSSSTTGTHCTAARKRSRDNTKEKNDETIFFSALCRLRRQDDPAAKKRADPRDGDLDRQMQPALQTLLGQ